MEHLELVEKLREKTGASYEDAKNALTACEWDMLDAVVYLEKLGKIQDRPTATYSTQYEKSAEFERATMEHSKENGFTETVNGFFGWCADMIKKGNENFLFVEHKGVEKIKVPVTILIVLLLLAFWVVVPMMLIGMFFDFRYHFAKDIEGMSLNNAMDKAAQAAEDLKQDLRK